MLLLTWPERAPSNTIIHARVDRITDWRMIGFLNGWQMDGSVTMDYSSVIQAVSHTARHILLKVSGAIKIGWPLGGTGAHRPCSQGLGGLLGLGKPKHVNVC